MANPVSLTITTAGTYVFGLDYFINPFNVGWEVYVPGGTTVSYGVDTTFDSINPTIGTGYGVVVAANPTWDVLQATSTSTTKNGNLQTPVQAMRVVVASISGGSITFKAVQPFSIN